METTPQPPITKPRSVKVASHLTDLSLGLGQIYCGHFVRGVVLYALCAAVFVAWVLLLVFMKGRFLQAMLMGLIPGTALWLFAKFDARRLAARAPADYVLKEYNRWYVYAMLGVVMLMLACCGAIIVRATAYEAFYIATDKMAPTLHGGQRVLANKTVYDVESMQRGDPVIVRSPTARRIFLVERLVGLPGDRVQLRGGELTVNGEKVSRRPAASMPQSASGPVGEPIDVTVPRGQGFFLNDNLQEGRDSRDLGTIPLSEVVGRIEVIYWPPQWTRVK